MNSFMLRASIPGSAFSIAAATASFVLGFVGSRRRCSRPSPWEFRTACGPADVHDDHDIQKHRTGFIEPDDRGRLAADVQSVADLPRLSLGSGWSRAIFRLMTMFGLPVSSRVENRLALLEGLGENRAVEASVGRDVLALDHRLVEDRLAHPLLAA